MVLRLQQLCQLEALLEARPALPMCGELTVVLVAVLLEIGFYF